MELVCDVRNFFEENTNYDGRMLAIEDGGQTATYKQLTEYAIQMVQYIAKRSLVFIFTSNKIGAMLGYLACLRNGVVPVLLSRNIDKTLVNNLLSLYLPQYIYVPDDMIECYSSFKIIFSKYGYAFLKTDYKKEFKLHADLALCLTTSGSTGSPKLVRQSYNNIAVNAVSIAEYLQLNEKERPITTLPMNYTYGLSIINSHVLVGATILLTDKGMMQKDFWSFFREQEATSFGGVPYHYEMLDRLRFYRMDLPSLRTMTQAGGKLSVELHKRFAEYAQKSDKHFVVMYGQCEATARMSYLPYEHSLGKCGSVGIAIPGGQFMLIDAEGNEISSSYVTGELVYEGPNVTLGYAESGDDLRKGDERRGRLYTGDMAQRDEEGFYYIVGRKKRFLKVYGNRVNLDEMESLLKAKFDCCECACTGVDDHVYIFITDASLKTDVHSFIAETTHLNPVAFTVEVLEEIPQNDSGKTKYVELEKYYRV